jgi:glycosyltransferase involved in cell wall biosynthesis
MMPPGPHLSLVVPVYDGAGYIEPNLREVIATLERGLDDRPFEIIVVCDGSRDRTVEIAQRVDHPSVRVFHYPVNQGKGFAIALGAAQAQGRLVGWLDSDLDIHPSAIVRMVRMFDAEDVDAVVGSKRHPESAVDYPPIRRLYSWGYQTLIRLLFRFNVRDTQVGAKVLRRDVMDTVVPLLLIKRYAFDVEVLAVAAGFGFDRVREMPVELSYRFSGTGIDKRAVGRMLQDTLAIAYRIHFRHYYVRRWASLHRQRVMETETPSGVALPEVMADAPPPERVG